MNTAVDLNQIASMIDISAVRTDVTLSELRDMADLARHYRFICAFTMPCYTIDLKNLLMDSPEVQIGGVVGFPSGADNTLIKAFTTRDLVATGCSEIDMVINVGALKSGQYDRVESDICAVVGAAEGRPVKAILEIAYLTQDEIKRASEIAIRTGVSFIKTGTGWANKPTTVDDVIMIKRIVGNSIKIKVAGGVRSLDTMLGMIGAGCCRFGIGFKSAMTIMSDVDQRLGRDTYRRLAI